MNIIVCLDDMGGLAFNRRRQSKDRIVREKILELACGERLYMNSYSFSQFEERPKNIIVCEDFLERAEEKDFCFVENESISTEHINTLYVFRWNRVYPADIKLNFDLNLIKTTNFKGFSHEKITLEVYEK